jgi:hypothetical protein
MIQTSSIKFREKANLIYTYVSGILDIFLCCIISSLVYRDFMIESSQTVTFEFYANQDSESSEEEEQRLSTVIVDSDQEEWENDFIARRASFERKMNYCTHKKSFLERGH